jgi:hypothetical protein
LALSSAPASASITQHNLDGYGTAPIDWQRVHDTMASDLPQAPGTGGPNRHTTSLTTMNPDGTPHVTPLGVVQLDGVWCFNSGPGTRKSRNLAADPRCVVSVATHPFDLVVEGSAAQ